MSKVRLQARDSVALSDNMSGSHDSKASVSQRSFGETRKVRYIWFDNQKWLNGWLKMNSARKTSKEYMLGMLGVEARATKQITRGLTKNGMTKDVAKLFVHNTKRRCLEVMHPLFTSSKELDGC